MADEFEPVALSAVLEGVVRRWADADAMAAAGKACWWQMREAGLVAVRACCANLVQVRAACPQHNRTRVMFAWPLSLLPCCSDGWHVLCESMPQLGPAC